MHLLTCCSLPCISQILPIRFFFFFFSSLFFSHRLRISSVTQGFFFWRCLPRISLAVSVTAVLKMVITESMSASSLFIMVRGAKLPAYQSLESFRHIKIFHLFEVKLESCVFLSCWFFSDERHHQQVVVTSNVCVWKTSCSGNVHSWSKALLH